MKTFASSESIDSAELEGLSTIAAQFYDMLADVRPELGHRSMTERRTSRESLLVDSAVMMHGYAAIMRDYNDAIASQGQKRAVAFWRQKLERFSASHRYRLGVWSGDFFEKANPLWRKVGVVKSGRDARRLTVLNTGAARGECGRVLRQFVSHAEVPRTLDFLSRT